MTEDDVSGFAHFTEAAALGQRRAASGLDRFEKLKRSSPASGPDFCFIFAP
jgi:hypothetical protein